jgi:hypothetical protein
MKFTGVVLISGQGRGGGGRKEGRKEGVHTESIYADVVTGETGELRNVAGVQGAKVEEVLPTLPH